MYKAARMVGLPPQTDRLPRYAPLSRLSGATPTRAATWPRFRLPNSGRFVSNIEESTGPTPGTLCISSSRARHMGDWRIILSMSLSRSSTCFLSHRMCLWIWGCTRLEAVRRRFRSEVTICSSWCRRSTRPRSSRVSSSGSGRTGGWITAANCASTWASITSVFADLPVARAKLRTCPGLTSDTANPANCSSTATNVSYPPVVSNTTPEGFTDAAYSTSAIIPSASFEYGLTPLPVLVATIKSVDETSIPTWTCLEMAAPPEGMNVLLKQAQPCTLRPRHVGAHNCPGSGSWGRDDLTEQRS